MLDEFHERSVHADLAIALARQAWRARDDLRIVVMSATLDSAAVSAFLDGCPVIDVPGRLHPLDIGYAPGQSVADAVAALSTSSPGDILCFLPGAFEIRRAIDEIGAGPIGRGSRRPRRFMDRWMRRRRIARFAPHDRRAPPDHRRDQHRRDVVDGSRRDRGRRHRACTRVARYDAERGIDSLDAGTHHGRRSRSARRPRRAAGPGDGAPALGCARSASPAPRARDSSRRSRCHRSRHHQPGAAIRGASNGSNRRQTNAIEAALTLLARLDALKDGALTAIGRQLQRLPLHPRLARMLVAANGARAMAQACALLSERHVLAPRDTRSEATTSDLLSAIDRWSSVPPHVQRVAREIEQLASNLSPVPPVPPLGGGFRRAVLAGYPDRVAQRREPRSPRVRLASGAGAIIAPQSGVTDGEFLVALDVQASTMSGPVEGARGATMPPTHGFASPAASNASGSSRTAPSSFSGSTPPAASSRPRWSSATTRWCWPSIQRNRIRRRPPGCWPRHGSRADRVRAMSSCCAGCGSPAGRLDLERARRARPRSARGRWTTCRWLRALTVEDTRALDRDAPETIVVPSGRDVRLEYDADGGVSASVKLQELFGLADTPRVGMRKEPVRLALLAPNGRPVQMTRDLRSFWDRTYPEVRKELRGRYPKHPWPEDPWTAAPTARDHETSNVDRRTARPGILRSAFYVRRSASAKAPSSGWPAREA